LITRNARRKREREVEYWNERGGVGGREKARESVPGGKIGETKLMILPLSLFEPLFLCPTLSISFSLSLPSAKQSNYSDNKELKGKNGFVMKMITINGNLSEKYFKC
jgi:hypothetical protein